MKLMLLVSAMNSGGAERVAATLCNAWAQRGDEVTLVATYSRRGPCDYALHPQVSLVHLADLVQSSRLAAFGYAGRLLALRRLIAGRQPDVVVSFLTNVNITAVLATRGLGVPLVVSERIDPVADQESTGAWRWLRRVLYPLADVVTVQTVAALAGMRSHVPRAKRIETVPNPIPDGLLGTPLKLLRDVAVRSSAGRPPRRRLVAMGRLAEQKQWGQLIEVFSGIAARHPDVDLWIWGEGSLRERLQRQVADSGLNGRVLLPGRTDSPWQEMAAGEILVLTSAYEGFPNVLLEAMALGLPCVSYDCPSGPREMTEDGRVAALVPLNDRAQLAQRLEALLNDPAGSRKLGRLGAWSVAARYGLPAVLQRWDANISLARGEAAAEASSPSPSPSSSPLPLPSLRSSSSPRIKVLFVISGLGAGGAERMLLKVASRLCGRFQMSVVSLTGRESMAADFEALGIPVLALGMRGVSSIPGAILRLGRHLRTVAPDVVSTWMYHADLVGGLAARLAGIRAVAWNIRNSDLSPAGSSRATRLVVWLNARLSRVLPQAILCCSTTARRIHVAQGYDDARFVMIANGFDLKQYQPNPDAMVAVRAELAIPQAAPLIGLVARWHPQKNHRGFVEAAALLHRRHPQVYFLLAGDGCDVTNPELRGWIAQAGLADVFRPVGGRNDIPRLTAALDIATSSSIFGEAFPNVIGEAMACGVPCVVTDVGDSGFIVGDTGKVVAPGQAQALAAAWSEILELDAGQRSALGRAARNRVAELFELGAVARRYEEAFLELAARPTLEEPCAA
jgi:glycosyltransferase involved in cell wall biosynthesis